MEDKTMRNIEKRQAYTVRDLFRAINIFGKDRDVFVDGNDSIAVCPPIAMTPEAREYFKKALDLPIDEDGDIISNNDDDYDEENEDSALSLAWEMLTSIAGYCPTRQFDKWFEGETAEQF